MQVAVGFFSRRHASRAVAFLLIGLIAAISLVQPAAADVPAREHAAAAGNLRNTATN